MHENLLDEKKRITVLDWSVQCWTVMNWSKQKWLWWEQAPFKYCPSHSTGQFFNWVITYHGVPAPNESQTTVFKDWSLSLSNSMLSTEYQLGQSMDCPVKTSYTSFVLQSSDCTQQSTCRQAWVNYITVNSWIAWGAHSSDCTHLNWTVKRRVDSHRLRIMLTLINISVQWIPLYWSISVQGYFDPIKRLTLLCEVWLLRHRTFNV